MQPAGIPTCVTRACSPVSVRGELRWRVDELHANGRPTPHVGQWRRRTFARAACMHACSVWPPYYTLQLPAVADDGESSTPERIICARSFSRRLASAPMALPDDRSVCVLSTINTAVS